MTSPIGTRAGRLGWVLYDWADTAFASLIQTFIFAAYFARQLAPDAQAGTLWWGLTIGGAGVVMALLAPLLGAAADRQGRLKPWLGVLMGLCVVSTAGLWWTSPGTGSVTLAMLLVALGTVGSQGAMVFYNALLPQLVPTERQGMWSGWGWAAGYAGGLCCLLVAWALFLSPAPWVPLDAASGQPVRATCLLVAAWLLLFSLPLFLLTPDRSGQTKPLRTALHEGLVQLRQSLKEVRRYRVMVRFLIAHLLYKDALAALFAMGGVYAASSMGMSEGQVLRFGLTLTLTAGLGAFAFAWVDRAIGSRRTVLLSLIGLMASASLLLFAGTDIESFWAMGAVMGVFVGPVQASSRAWLAKSAPEELRTQMFGLFALSGRATAFVGPLLVSATTYATGSATLGMASLLILLAAGFVLFWRGVPDSADAAAGR